MAFNSPEGIRLIDTLKKDMCLAMLSNTFNSPEGIRLIDTFANVTQMSQRDFAFNSPEGIRLIDTQIFPPAVLHRQGFQLP